MLVQASPFRGSAQVSSAPLQGQRSQSRARTTRDAALALLGYFKHSSSRCHWLQGEVAACQGQLQRPCARGARSNPAAAPEAGSSRKQGEVLSSPCSGRVHPTEVGGEPGARVPAELLCHAGLSQGLAHCDPNHYGVAIMSLNGLVMWWQN